MFRWFGKFFASMKNNEILQGTPEGDIVEVIGQSKDMILVDHFSSIFFEKKRYLPETETIKKLIDEGVLYLVTPPWGAHHRLTLGEKAPKWAKEIFAPPQAKGENIIKLR